MNKKKAISILKAQIKKLEQENARTTVWETQTKAYIKIFFGENSLQFEYFKRFSFLSMYTYDPVLFLTECIEFIQNNGLYKMQKKNFLESLPNWLIMLLIPALFSTGIIMGKYTSDIQNIELKRELKELKTSISIISTDSITNKIENHSNNPNN